MVGFFTHFVQKLPESLIRINSLVFSFPFLKNIRRLIAGMKDNLAFEQADCEGFEQAAASVYHRIDALEQK